MGGGGGRSYEVGECPGERGRSQEVGEEVDPRLWGGGGG